MKAQSATKTTRPRTIAKTLRDPRRRRLARRRLGGRGWRGVAAAGTVDLHAQRRRMRDDARADARTIDADRQRAHATFTLKPPAYFAGSLPSQTTPSISFEVRIRSLGTLTFAAAAACL